MTEDANAAQAAFWEDRAPSWLLGEQHSAKVAGPFGRQAMSRLRLRPGQRVLDIGCGSGPTTIELARLVAPGGEVTGADIAPAMVAAAQRRAEAEGVTDARFVVADVQTADWRGATFDAAFSQFGVMFFSDPELAFANVRAALRPGGTLTFTCWQDLFSNEWMFIPGSAVMAVTGALPPMPGPDEPGPFSLAEPGRAAHVLERAGFADIQVEPVADPVVLPESDVASLATTTQHFGPVREALQDADDDTRHRVLDAVREALEAKVSDGELRLSAAAFIVSATA